MNPDPGADTAPDPAGQLAGLLRQRIALIADHAFRDRDPAEHLAALKAVSSEIAALAPAFAHDPRMQHFLERCSYEKALAWLESGGRGGTA